MRTIAVLTDFGLKDTYVGIIKAVLLKLNPCINLVDITHEVSPQNISEASFLLKNSFNYFPKNTIFLVIVDPGVGSLRKPIIVQTRNYIFVGPDNGVLYSAVYEDGIKKIIEIQNRRYFLKPISDTFHGRDIFAPTAAYISKGVSLDKFGKTLSSIKKLDLPKPKFSKHILAGEVIYIDNFGNLVTNIDRITFNRFIGNKRFRIRIRNKYINSISKSYQDISPGRPLAIFGSSDYLEISVNCGNARQYFKTDLRLAVYIKIFDFASAP